MSKICIVMDYGHRLTTPGKRTVALPRVIHERTMNEGYGSVAANLFRKAGCEVLEVAPDKNAALNENTDLNQRIAKANIWASKQNGQAYYISCHANAGGGQGAEVWIWSGSKAGGKEGTSSQIGAGQTMCCNWYEKPWCKAWLSWKPVCQLCGKP